MLCWTAVAALLVLVTATLAAPDDVSVRINPNRPVAKPIRPNFVGFSLETWTTPTWFGPSGGPVKPSYLSLMKQLMFTPGQDGPVFRIGGNSADESAFSANGTRVRGASFVITAGQLIAINEAVKAVNGKAVHDLNFRTPDPSLAVRHAQAIDRLIGWRHVAALEIGNECDLYKDNGYRNSSTWSMTAYTRQWRSYVDAIRQAVPTAPQHLYQGATFAMSSWFQYLLPFARSQVADLATISIHNYPNTHCSGHIVTIDELLSDRQATQAADYIRQYNLVVGLANLSIPLVVGEANSVSCSGMPGVSNTFASALWIIDYLFNVASTNAHSINFHQQNSTSSYATIVWTSSEPDTPIIQPSYYGISVWNWATRDHCRIATTSRLTQSAPYVKVWSCASDRRLTITVVHKNYTVTEPARVMLNVTHPSLSGSNWFPNATVSHLTATSVTEQRDIEWAGRTWRNTTDGRPSGARRVLRVAPLHRANRTWAVYEVTIRPASALVVEIEWERRPPSTASSTRDDTASFD